MLYLVGSGVTRTLRKSHKRIYDKISGVHNKFPFKSGSETRGGNRLCV